ncbi:sensor histidine kinase [Kaarinaea lacus]
MNSIQTRLVGGLIISLIIFLIIQWLLIGTSIRYLSEAYVATRLEHDAESLLSALDFNAQPPQLNADIVGSIYKQPFSGHYYTLKINNVEVRSRSLWDTNLPIVKLEHGKSQVSRLQGPQKQMLLVFHASYKKGTDLIFISVAEDLTSILQDIDIFQLQHSVISVAILSILVLFQRFIVKRNLKPLDSVRSELEKLEKGVINQLSETVPVEILPLVKELNLQLFAIKKRLERSRNASGNLAHALKTPLTLISQLANGDELAQFPQIKNQLLQYSKSIQQSIDRELKRARMAGSTVTGSHTYLLKEVNDLLKTLSAMYQQKNIFIDVKIPQALVCSIDRQDMLEILGNILENAYKWSNKKIQITAEQNEQTFISIEDDGPGHEIDDMEKLISRGMRADEKIEGHGLGLSIVSEIIKEYRGKLEFSRSRTLGGFRVCIWIPKK